MRSFELFIFVVLLANLSLPLVVLFRCCITCQRGSTSLIYSHCGHALPSSKLVKHLRGVLSNSEYVCVHTSEVHLCACVYVLATGEIQMRARVRFATILYTPLLRWIHNINNFVTAIPLTRNSSWLVLFFFFYWKMWQVCPTTALFVEKYY